MWLTETSYDTVVAFIEGYNAAMMGGLLVGFREWLITRIQGGNNLSWSALVDLAADEAQTEPAATADDARRREALFELLSQFFAERSGGDGVRSIFRRYEAWLATQSWSQS